MSRLVDASAAYQQMSFEFPPANPPEKDENEAIPCRPEDAREVEERKDTDGD